MKRILLVLFTLISLNAFSQLQVKEGSFKHIPNAVMNDKYDHIDDNDLPMALIKISTENIPEQERLRMMFQGNLATQITKTPKTGQMWIYISAENATFINFMHPDYGTYKYYFPEKLCDFCTYEMVLQYVNNNSSNTYISVDSEPSGADIYIDGKHYGKTPNIITDLPMGKHEIKLEKQEYNPVTKIFIIEDGEKLKFNETLLSVYYKASAVEDDKVVAIEKEKPEKKPVEKVKPEKKAESLPKTNFLTLNAAYSVAPQTSFGFNFGSVKKVGWFVSAMSNFDFIGFNTIDKPYEEVILTGNAKDTRISVTGGVIAKIGGPVYFKAGAGYGMIIRCCETASGDYVEYTPNTYKGVDFTAGLQLNLRNLTIGIDAVTTNFQMMEFKLGIGFNWN